MRNKYYLISLFLLGIILFNFSFGFVQAFDDYGNDNDQRKIGKATLDNLSGPFIRKKKKPKGR